MEKAKVVKWKTGPHWNYGVVLTEATSSDPEGPYVEVEYTHSVPASNVKAGRVIRIYGVHKVQPV